MLARQKLDWGLVNLVAPDNGLAATLADLVATLAEKKPHRPAPHKAHSGRWTGTITGNRLTL